MSQTKLSSLVINKLTQQQFDNIPEKEPNQLYFITDGLSPDDVATKDYVDNVSIYPSIITWYLDKNTHILYSQLPTSGSEGVLVESIPHNGVYYIYVGSIFHSSWSLEYMIKGVFLHEGTDRQDGVYVETTDTDIIKLSFRLVDDSENGPHIECRESRIGTVSDVARGLAPQVVDEDLPPLKDGDFVLVYRPGVGVKWVEVNVFTLEN